LRLFAIGDVVGSVGCRFLREKLPAFKRYKGIDVVIANAENSADGNGVTAKSVRYLLDSGVDLLTGGNHSFRRRETYDLYDECEQLLRPANFPSGAPGRGFAVLDFGRVQLGVLNLLGTVYMEAMDNPFYAADALLKDAPKMTVVDFHAEATGEKRSLGYYLDGRVSAVWGTHTHVQTSDACVLPKGTGYISDLGMTGPVESVLGVKPELTIQKMRTKMPVRFALVQEGPMKLNGCLFDLDEKTGRCRSAEAVELR